MWRQRAAVAVAVAAEAGAVAASRASPPPLAAWTGGGESPRWPTIVSAGMVGDGWGEGVVTRGGRGSTPTSETLLLPSHSRRSGERGGAVCPHVGAAVESRTWST